MALKLYSFSIGGIINNEPCKEVYFLKVVIFLLRYRKMDACITPLPEVKNIRDISGGAIEKWPKRLNTVPQRIRIGAIVGVTIRTFNEDNQLWKRRVSYYGSVLKSLFVGQYRNIMDMNAGIGGFAAALVNYPVWVMNVVPSDAKNNTLAIIYERGLIGTYMNW